MLMTVGIVLLVLWALGLFAFHVSTGLIHLLVLSGLKVAVFARIVQGALKPLLGPHARWPALAFFGLLPATQQGKATPTQPSQPNSKDEPSLLFRVNSRTDFCAWIRRACCAESVPSPSAPSREARARPVPARDCRQACVP